MTKALIGQEVAKQVAEQISGAIVEANETCIIVKPDLLAQVIQFLNTSPNFKFNFLNCITGVDYMDYLEVVYNLSSMEHNHSIVVKVRCDRENAEVPSIYNIFRGADYQEREIYDLVGVKFTGHPNMKRLFMWESFEGHPLRRDFL